MADTAPHKQALVTAHSILLEINSALIAYQVAIIRQSPQTEIEALRHRAHDLLDACLDQHNAAARATLSLLG